MSCHIIYTTFSNKAEAERLIALLLEKRLIACANLFPNVTSYYRWEGKLAQEEEIVVILKTTEELTQAAIDQLKSEHQYDCPAILIVFSN